MADDMSNAAAYEPNLLARYRGQKPDAPAWFEAAIATPYETHIVAVDGIKIHYQTYGDRTKPGLLLAHGNGAHAHWYDFIAPALAEDYYVVSMTFSGMGDSDWRSTYSFPTFAEEQLAVCEHAGLFEGGRKPVIAAHSFGGFITLHAARKHADKFTGVIIIDSGIRPPDDEWEGPPRRARGNRAYVSLEAALARFRLAPPQPCEHHYIADYIARHSLKQVEADNGQTGWIWKFDPGIFVNFEFSAMSSNLLADVSCHVALMRGQDSELVTDRIWDYMRSLRSEPMDMVSIPNAQHHVLLDQPLAFIEALQTQLKRWDF
ncbi:MAG: alpha/beta hydrolase [Pseudomonadota bacterium]